MLWISWPTATLYIFMIFVCFFHIKSLCVCNINTYGSFLTHMYVCMYPYIHTYVCTIHIFVVLGNKHFMFLFLLPTASSLFQLHVSLTLSQIPCNNSSYKTSIQHPNIIKFISNTKDTKLQQLAHLLPIQAQILCMKWK